MGSIFNQWEEKETNSIFINNRVRTYENCLEMAVILLVYGTEEEGILGSWWCARERKKERKRIMTAVRCQAAMVVEPSFASRERRENREGCAIEIAQEKLLIR